MNSLNQLVEEIVSESGIKKEKDKENLRKELYSHFWDESRELALQGYNEEKMTESVRTRFGNIESIGKQLFIVHFMKTITFEEKIIMLMLAATMVGLIAYLVLPGIVVSVIY
jgi:hypothetical protein